MQELKNNLFFVGIKHSGKTTFASRIASRINVESSDSDDLILETLGGESVREYYRREGKEAFMKKEVEAVSSYISSHKKSPFILSLGGGASDNFPLLSLLHENGKIIYLKRNEKDMLEVILKHGIPAFLDKESPEYSFSLLYERRNAIYEKEADLVIDLGPYRDKKETEDFIFSILKENNYVQ